MSHSAQSINLESMVRGAFTSAEIEVLNTCPAFATELQTVKTVDEFEVLCLIGHELLLEKSSNASRKAGDFDGDRLLK